VRKVWEHSGLVDERIYLGGWEVYRRRDASGVLLERQTLHAMDGMKRIALVEATTVGEGGTATRFQLGNHLGSAVLEVDEAGRVLSYEEYHPYGTTAYQAGTGAAEASLKRYRFTGKERDEETGLYYHGARYYAPWLGRWASADPIHPMSAQRSSPNRYAYVLGRVIVANDPDGRDYSMVVEATKITIRVNVLLLQGADAKPGQAEAVKAAAEKYWNAKQWKYKDKNNVTRDVSFVFNVTTEAETTKGTSVWAKARDPDKADSVERSKLPLTVNRTEVTEPPQDPGTTQWSRVRAGKWLEALVVTTNAGQWGYIPAWIIRDRPWRVAHEMGHFLGLDDTGRSRFAASVKTIPGLLGVGTQQVAELREDLLYEGSGPDAEVRKEHVDTIVARGFEERDAQVAAAERDAAEAKRKNSKDAPEKAARVERLKSSAVVGVFVRSMRLVD